MGVYNCPDIFQKYISELFDGFNMVGASIDEVLIITENNFDEHLKDLYRVIQTLAEAVLKVNAERSFFV